MVKKTATAENSKVPNGKTSVKTGKLKKRKETSPQQKNVGDNEIKRKCFCYNFLRAFSVEIHTDGKSQRGTPFVFEKKFSVFYFIDSSEYSILS